MSDTTLPTASPDPGTTPTPTQPPDAGSQAAATEDKGPIPFERWEQTNQRMKAAEAKLAELTKAEEARAAEAKKAEEARLAEQQKWQELAERYKGEAEGLKPHQDKATRYETALTAILETERKGLARHVLELLDNLDPAAQLEYIAKHRDTLRPQSPPDINGASTGKDKKPGPGDAMRQAAKKYGIRIPAK